jgi:hypothetical protein
MDADGGLTPRLLIEELGLYAGPAVWGYRDAVMAAANDLGVTVDSAASRLSGTWL